MNSQFPDDHVASPSNPLVDVIIGEGNQVETSAVFELSTTSMTVAESEIRRIEAELKQVLGTNSGDLLAGIYAADQPQCGKYLIQKILGERGQAYVFQAFDPDLQRQVVVKLYRSDLPVGQKERLFQEGRALSRINSDYVVKCFAVEEIVGCPALILEYLPGRTLDQFLREKTPSETEVVGIACELLQGVGKVHDAGLLHGDLKPGNVLIGPDGQATIIDFGLSQAICDTGPYELTGSPGFMAPERARNETSEIDRRSDVFGVGAILHFLIYGRAPFQGKSRQAIFEATQKGKVSHANPLFSVSPQLEVICKKAIANRPSDRYRDADDFRTALEGVVSQPVNWNHRAWIASSVLLSVLVLVMIIQGGFGSVGDDPESKNRSTPDVSQTERITGRSESTSLSIEQQMEQFSPVNQIEYRHAVMIVEDGKFKTIEPDDNGTIILKQDIPTFLVVDPEEACYALLFSVEYSNGCYVFDTIFPFLARDSEPMLPLAGSIESLAPGEFLDSAGFSNVNNFIGLNPNTAPQKNEFFFLVLSSLPIEDPGRYLELIRQRQNDTALPSLTINEIDELVRGVDRRHKRKISAAAFRYRVQSGDIAD